MKPLDIPFNQPSVEGREMELMRQAVANGHTSAAGPFSQQVAEYLADELGAQAVLPTTSCTAALELAGMLIGFRPGDTVIVPSFSYVTSASAFVRAGARVVFADIEPRTLGIDPDHVATLLDASTRAVVAIHYGGVACDLAGLGDVLGGSRVDLVEDNAHGLFGAYRGEPLGSFGRFSTLSFHETKNFTCGEGGALAVNRAADVEQAYVLYHKGTDRRAFERGEVDKYSWRALGSSFGLSDTLAAYLAGQLEARDRILAKRRAVYEAYDELLRPQAAALGLQLPDPPADRQPAYHMYYVLAPDCAGRDHAIQVLRERGVHAVFHYVPLHDSAAGIAYRARETHCPVSADVSARLLRLPFFNDLPRPTIERVVELLVGALA